jgi:hypothetical protein
MKKIVFIVGLFYSLVAMAEDQVNCVSSRDEMSGQVTSKCTVKETSGDFTTDFLKSHGYDVNSLINPKPVAPTVDIVKTASDMQAGLDRQTNQIMQTQQQLEQRQQKLAEFKQKKELEVQSIADFNNYKDGLNKTITSLETQAGRKLNDDERLRVYTTYQKQLTDRLNAVGRNDLAEQAKVIYDPKLLFSLDRGSQAVPQQVNDVSVSNNNEDRTAYVILASIIIGIIGFGLFRSQS